MNISIALTAALYGATLVNHAEVNELIKDPATGQITGVKVKDLLYEQKNGKLGKGEGLDQDTFEVRAKVCALLRTRLKSAC